MDHPVQLSAPQPWRAAALVAATIAAVELFLLVVLGFVLGARLFTQEVERVAEPVIAAETQAAEAEAQAAPAASSRESGAPVTLARRETSVIVLNGNGITGAASIAAERVQRRGYLIAGTANAPRTNFKRNIVMYRPGREAEAQRLARDLKVKRVAPLDGIRVADLQGAHIALIVGG